MMCSIVVDMYGRFVSVSILYAVGAIKEIELETKEQHTHNEHRAAMPMTETCNQ